MEETQDQFEPDNDGYSLTFWDVWGIVVTNWRIFVACAVIGALIGGAGAALKSPTYSAKATAHMVANRGSYLDAGASVIGSPNMWTQDAYLQTQLQIMKSGDLRRSIIQRYNQFRGDDALKVSPGMLGGATKLKQRPGTELVDITVTTHDPQLSADLANITAEALRDETMESKIEAARDANVWLTTQLEEWDRKITEANAKLTAYHRSTNVNEIGRGRTTLESQLNSLKEAYGQAKTERVLHESQVKGYEELWRRGRYLDLAEQLPGPLMDPLAGAYADAKLKHDVVARQFMEKMPQFKESQLRLNEEEKRLKTEVRRVLDTEQAKLRVKQNTEENLYAAISGGEENKLDLSVEQEDYQKLLLDLDAAKNVYAKMKERLAEIDLQANTQLNHIRLIQRARVPGSSRMQDAQMMIGGGLVGGLVLGGLIVGLREYLDDTIKSPFDILTYVKVPVIGLIPRVEGPAEQDRSLYTHFNPKSPTAEATRALRTYIELNPTGTAPRRLMVTSAMTAEGKTSTAVRLAISYANLGRSVVLIDMDLRRPRIHKLFEHKRTVGVTSVLLDGVPVDRAVRETGIEGLSYMSSGPSTTHPGELLASSGLQTMLDNLNEMFDMVIIDTPPTVILADARVVSRLADAVLLVVRDKSTSRVPVRDAVRGLLDVGANLLGVTLNDVDLSKASAAYGYTYRYGYRYSYGYQYTYGYGTQPDDQTESAAK